MDMAMDKVGRFIFFQQPVKGLETGVRNIFPVIEPIGRSMGYENVEAPVQSQLWPQPEYSPIHGVLGILVEAVTVAQGASQSENPDSFIVINLSLIHIWIPGGWIIVTAGNPPEYNKSVREFDIATLDRIKKIEMCIRDRCRTECKYSRFTRTRPDINLPARKSGW